MSTESKRPSVQRQHLATVTVGRSIDRVEAHRVTLQPGQPTGLHFHAGGTIGFVVDGEIAFQLEGGPLTTLQSGDGFFEPAGQHVARFDNLSDTQAATFIACYPLAGEETLITMIEPQA